MLKLSYTYHYATNYIYLCNWSPNASVLPTSSPIQMKKTESLLIVLMAVLSAAAQGLTLTPATHLPADSADLAILSVPFFPPGEAGENQLWDMGTIYDADPLPMLSLRRDSLGRHSVIFGREVRSFAKVAEELMYVECESPLRHAWHHSPAIVLRFPLTYGDTLSSPFHHTGRYSGRYYFNEDGIHTVEADAAGSLILTGDTMGNVLRVHSRKTSSIVMGLDSAMLSQLPAKRQTTDCYTWYARGYRYPFLCSVIQTLNDDTCPVEVVRKSYFLPPSIQASLADSVNEGIRLRDLQMRDSCRKAPPCASFHYTMRLDGNTLIVDYSPGSSPGKETTVTLVLSDSMGIVYRRKSVSDASGEPSSIRTDCSGLRHGQYILYINVNGNVYHENFVI